MESGDFRRAYTPDDGRRPVHAYPPWAYTVAFPFAKLSPLAAGLAMELLQILCVACIAIWCFLRGRTETGADSGGLFCAAAALFLGTPLRDDLVLQNYCLLAAAATLGLVSSLERGRSCLAGLCLAVMMLKAQYGALFVIPLLWRKQFATLGTAIALCLALSWPAAGLTNTPITLLLLETVRAGGGYYVRTALLPAAVFQTLSAHVGMWFPVAASAVVGVGLCCWLTWLMRRRSWFEFLLPTVFCSAVWTHSLLYARVPYALLLCFAAERLWRAAPGRETFWHAVALAALMNGLVLYFPLRLDSGDWIAAHLAPGVAPDALRRLSRLADLPFFGIAYVANYVTLAWLILVARRAARTPPEEAIP